MRYWKTARILVVSALALSVAACAGPELKISKIDKPDTEGLIKYKLVSSTLVFGYQPDKDGKPKKDTMTVASAPVAVDELGLYGIAGKTWSEAWGVETRLSATYRSPQSDQLEKIGVQVEDKRVAIINAIGGAVVSLAGLGILGFGPAEEGGSTLPAGIDFYAFMKTAHANPKCKQGAEQLAATGKGKEFVCTDLELSGLGDWRADMKIGPAPASAAARESLTFPLSGPVMIYPACRNLTIEVYKGSSASRTVEAVKGSLLVADADWIETASVPYKGSVTFNVPCGASTSNEGGSATTGADYVGALLAQAKSVKDALAKNNETGAK
jgi:hypothetical protein